MSSPPGVFGRGLPRLCWNEKPRCPVFQAAGTRSEFSLYKQTSGDNA